MNTPNGQYPIEYCNDTLYSSWNTDLSDTDMIEKITQNMKSDNIYENKLVSIKAELLETFETLDDSFKEDIEKDDTYKNEIKEITGNINLIDNMLKKIEHQSEVVLEKEIVYKKQMNDTKGDIEKLDTFNLFLKDIHLKFPENNEINNISQDICNLSEKIKNENNCLTSRREYQKELYLLNEYHNLLKKINNGNIGNTCSLCLQNPVNKYFNPCGHTACDKCIDKLYEKSENQYTVNCFLCRKRINSNHSIYFI